MFKDTESCASVQKVAKCNRHFLKDT
uniref:Uncharacterized protein n=1 Tax=Arundo donax TaxID=35708 RepID=A0A0A8Z7Z4_ARUDO